MLNYVNNKKLNTLTGERKCTNISTSAHQPISIPKIWLYIHSFIIKNLLSFNSYFTRFFISFLNFHFRVLAILFLLCGGLPVFALSATTATTIKGTAPYLLLGSTPITHLNQLAGFTMPKRDGTPGIEFIDASMASIAIAVPAGTTLNQIIPLVTADGVAHSLASAGVNIGDDDGDVTMSNPGTVSGSITALWRQGSTHITNLNQKFSFCSPYTLTVEVNNIEVNTTYGDPHFYSYGSMSIPITYTFTLQGVGICYIEPADMTVYAGLPLDHSLFPVTGYNPNIWEAGKGFSVDKLRSLGSEFPTTAFDRAAFTLVGIGSDQSVYRCHKRLSSDPVNLSGSNSCTVTFTATRPTTTINIDMDYTSDGGISWVQIDSYTIPAPILWARPVGTHQYNNSVNNMGTYDAAIACGAPAGLAGLANQAIAASYFFSRTEISNSPEVYIPAASWVQDPDTRNKRYARDLGTFMSEWGSLYNYSGSGWDETPSYWTNEHFDNGTQFRVTENGSIFPGTVTTVNYTAVCRQ